MKELYHEIARLFYEAFASFFKAAVDALSALFTMMRKEIPQSQRNADTTRRDWTRPRNQKIRPLMLDRRNRVFHCRNAI